MTRSIVTAHRGSRPPGRWPTILVALALCVGTVSVAPTASAARVLCVSHQPGCSDSLQAAIDLAQPGDVIRIARGVFAGGVTISKSISLVGSGPGSTVIRGGGPVLTIGVFDAPSEPTVSVRGVTITGGVTYSSTHCGPNCGTSYVHATALGGGIEVPPAAGSGLGATVSISDTVIAGNRVAPIVTVPSVRAVCPSGPCRFALAGGGGIDNWGTMTLTRTVVRDNHVGGPLASDADGAGILNEGGSLTIRDSVVSNNHAVAGAPNGRFADSGGIFMNVGHLDLRNSVVAGNQARLTAAWPDDVNTLAIAGGIHVTSDASAMIRSSRVSRNHVNATNSAGFATAFSGGIHADGQLELHASIVSRNNVRATTTFKTGNAQADSGAGEMNNNAVIDNSRLSHNHVTAKAVDGQADVSAGAIVAAAFDHLTITGSIIAGNRLTATSTGRTTAAGAGIANIGSLTLRHTKVAHNKARVTGTTGLARGGGIANASAPDGPPVVRLDLINSRVTHNALVTSPGITAHGGGIYGTVPVTLSHSSIEHNRPDQCYACNG